MVTMSQPQFPTPDLPPAPRTTEMWLPLARAVGVALLVAAVVNLVFGFRFPYNAPVESIYMYGITIDLLVAGGVILGRSVLHSRRPRAAARPPRAGALSVIALVLSAIAFLAFLPGEISFLADIASGERARYMTATGAVFLAGAPWALGFIFGVGAYRRDGGRANAVLSILAIVLGLVVTIGVVASSVVYGLGLSD